MFSEWDAWSWSLWNGIAFTAQKLLGSSHDETFRATTIGRDKNEKNLTTSSHSLLPHAVPNLRLFSAAPCDPNFSFLKPILVYGL